VSRSSIGKGDLPDLSSDQQQTTDPMKTMFLFMAVLAATSGIGQEAAQAAFSAGVAHLKAKEFKDAENSFKTALEVGETEQGLKMANVYMGFALNGQGKHSEAITFFTEAIRIDPMDPKTYLDRGAAYARSRKNADAIKDFQYVLTLDSISDQAQAAYYWLGRIADAERDHELAIEYYTKLLQLAPTDFEVYYLRGTAKSNLMDSEGAIEDFDMALKYKPDYMEALANRGVCKINLVPMSTKQDKDLDCLDDPCEDLLKAKAMGDTSVEDMIYLYCKKCK